MDVSTTGANIKACKAEAGELSRGGVGVRSKCKGLTFRGWGYIKTGTIGRVRRWDSGSKVGVKQGPAKVQGGGEKTKKTQPTPPPTAYVNQ